MQHSFPALFVVLFALALPSAADVLRVAVDGSADFTQVRQAYFAAEAGDVILVAPGIYWGVDIESKGVSIVAESEDTVVRYVTVSNLGSGQDLFLRGFRTSRLECQNCLGSVWVEDSQICSLGLLSFVSVECLLIDGCSDVTLVQSTVEYEDSSLATSLGIRFVDSSVQLYDSSFLGPPGPDPSDPWSLGENHGANAIVLESSQLFASGCSIRGGDGGNYTWYCEWPGCPGGKKVHVDAGDAGDGLVLLGTSDARLRACLVSPGIPGVNTAWNPMPTGDPGQAFTVEVGSQLDELCGVAQTLRMPAVAAGSGTMSALVLSRPGDMAFVLRTINPHAIQLEQPFVGTLFHSSGYDLFFAGLLDSLGELCTNLPTPPLPPGVDAIALTHQPILVGGTFGALSIGAPSRTIIL